MRRGRGVLRGEVDGKGMDGGGDEDKCVGRRGNCGSWRER